MFNIHCSFINIELKAKSTIPHAWMKLIEVCFLYKAHHNLLVLRNSRQHCCTMWGLFWTANSMTKKCKNVKSLASNRYKTTTHLLTVWELKKKAECCLIQSQLWDVCVGKLTFFCCCANAQEWPWKSSEYWFWRFKKILVSKRICQYRIQKCED